MEAPTFLKRVEDDLCLMYLLLTSDKADDNTNKQNPEQIFGKLMTDPLDLYSVLDLCFAKYTCISIGSISMKFMKRIIVAKNLLNTKPGPFNSKIRSPSLSGFSKSGLFDIVSRMFPKNGREGGITTIFREPATSAGILTAMLTMENIQRVAEEAKCGDPFHCRNFISLLNGIVDYLGNESEIVKSLKRSCQGEGLEKIIWFGDGVFVDHSRALAVPHIRKVPFCSLFIKDDVLGMDRSVTRAHLNLNEQSERSLYERGLSFSDYSKFCETVNEMMTTLTLPPENHQEEERFALPPPPPTLKIKDLKVNGMFVSDFMSHPKVIMSGGDTTGLCHNPMKSGYPKAVCIVFAIDRETGENLPFRYLSIGDKEFLYSDTDYCQGTGCTSSGQPILRASNVQNSREYGVVIPDRVSVYYRLRDEDVDYRQRPENVDLYCSYITTFYRDDEFVLGGLTVDCLTAFSVMSGRVTTYTGTGNRKRLFKPDDDNDELLTGRVKVSKICSVSFSLMNIICFGKHCNHYGFFDFCSIMDFMIKSDYCPKCDKGLKYGDLVIVDPSSFRAYGIEMMENPDTDEPFSEHFYYYESEGILSQEPLENNSRTSKRQAVEVLDDLGWIEELDDDDDDFNSKNNIVMGL